MSKKISDGKHKNDDSLPITSFESVISDSLWAKLKVKEGNESLLKLKLKVT